MGTQTGSDSEFNVIQFEKRLTQLKDSQENINACCKWCLENRKHHKKIVNSWLNVLKRVKIEQRVNLFYLANDVIQYSKRKNYEFVDSWGTALQKATTLVRDDKVKHKIIRIFNIWQQRNVYNEEFISDLCGLISVVPTASKNDEPHEFQASYVINKIKHCSKLENETDLKLKVFKEHNPKIPLETESLCTSLKDRAHVDDVEKELETYVKHLEGYINALKAEIKCRITNISVLKQANGHLDKDKKDVKVVANAYRTFGTRIKAFQKKLEEHKINLTSPIPSPDINAPSPSPDSDIELPDDNEKLDSSLIPGFNSSISSFTAGYYNPVPPPAAEVNSNFVTNGYTSFLGSNLANLTSTLFTTTQSTTEAASGTEVSDSNAYGLNTNMSNVLQTIAQPPPPPMETSSNESFQFQQQQSGGHMPLLPPPMPPFSTSDTNYNYNNAMDKPNFVAQQQYTSTNEPPSNFDSSMFDTSQVSSFGSAASDYANTSSFSNQIPGSNPYPPSQTEEYNPEQEPDTWEPDNSWMQPTPLDTDTPESPPMFEKESFNEPPVEYHDNIDSTGASDVDHRVLRHATPVLENVMRVRGKDVDHRNLISLTGSPADTNNAQSNWGSQDQDYRMNNGDQDYRLHLNIEQLKLPPPPPPPATGGGIKGPPQQSMLSATKKQSPSPRKFSDSNVESIDMDLSEDETETALDNGMKQHQDNLKVLVGDDGQQQQMGHHQQEQETLKPPPPLPDLPDDVDANTFLDSLTDDLNSQEFTANLTDLPATSLIDHHHQQQQQHHQHQHQPPPPPQQYSSGSINHHLMGPQHSGLGNNSYRLPPPMPQSQHHHQHHQMMGGGGDGDNWGNNNYSAAGPPPPPPGLGFRGRPHPRGSGYNNNMMMRNNNQRGKGRGNFAGYINRGGQGALMRGGRGGFGGGGRGQMMSGRPLRGRGNRGNYQGGY